VFPAAAVVHTCEAKRMHDTSSELRRKEVGVDIENNIKYPDDTHYSFICKPNA
jgi:hypothetical protein